MDPDEVPDPAIFVIDLQDANKKIIFKKFFCLLFLPYQVQYRAQEGASFFVSDVQVNTKKGYVKKVTLGCFYIHSNRSIRIL